VVYWHDALLAIGSNRTVVEVHLDEGHPQEVDVYHQDRHLRTARCFIERGQGELRYASVLNSFPKCEVGK
jgi:hypothetical protein